MATSSFCSLPLTLLLLLFHGGLARHLGGLQSKNECELDSLSALEPSNPIECEAGRFEFFDQNSPELQCAGVAVVRGVIEPNGLYLPTFLNAPELFYIVQGTAIMGRVMPGCPETYMDSERFQGEQGRHSQQGQRSRDMHQKVEYLRQGAVAALPVGVAHWCYNDGDEPLVIISLIDLSNHNNQLDQNPRSFFLAGSDPQGPAGLAGKEGSHGHQEQQQRRRRNVFNGLDPEILAQVFNIDLQTAQKLQNRDDNRGNIVRVRGRLQIVRPPATVEHEDEYHKSRRSGGDNGLEETLCSARFCVDIDDPSRADVYQPHLGYISTVNGLSLPILRQLRLSAVRGVMNRESLMLPYWNLNAHMVIYVTRGRGRIQVVDDNGRSVFNQGLSQGQLLTVPQGYVVVKRAEDDRFEWISFKTNDNVMMSTLAGSTSLMMALPSEVISNAFQVSNEEAMRIKFSTTEATLTHVRREWGINGSLADGLMDIYP